MTRLAGTIITSLQLDREAMDALEALIDKHGLCSVTNALASIASEKADHIASNWRDHILEKAWNNSSVALQKAEYAVWRALGDAS